VLVIINPVPQKRSTMDTFVRIMLRIHISVTSTNMISRELKYISNIFGDYFMVSATAAVPGPAFMPITGDILITETGSLPVNCFILLVYAFAPSGL